MTLAQDPDDLAAPPPPNRRALYDPRVTLGNLLTLVSMLFAGIAMIVVWLLWGVRQEERINHTIYRVSQLEEQVEDALVDFGVSLDRLEGRIEARLDEFGDRYQRLEGIILQNERNNP